MLVEQGHRDRGLGGRMLIKMLPVVTRKGEGTAPNLYDLIGIGIDSDRGHQSCPRRGGSYLTQKDFVLHLLPRCQGKNVVVVIVVVVVVDVCMCRIVLIVVVVVIGGSVVVVVSIIRKITVFEIG